MEGLKKVKKVSNDSPLDGQQKINAAGLFRRAVQFGQTRELKDVTLKTISARDSEKPYQKLMEELTLVSKIADNMPELLLDPRAFVNQHQIMSLEGSMNDASKRRRDVEAASSVGEADWERVTQSSDEISVLRDQVRGGPNYVGEAGYPTPMPTSSNVGVIFGQTVELPFLPYVNHKIKVPEGMTMHRWADELCKMDKVKSLKLTYRELIEAAKTDVKIGEYLNWIIEHYGSDVVGLDPKKITPAVDLAFYLEAVGWTWNEPINKKTTFKRETRR